MFKQRLVTGAALIALVFLMVFALPPRAFVGAMDVIVILAAAEWAELNRFRGIRKWGYAAAAGACAAASLWLPPTPLLLMSVGFWVWLFLELIGPPLERGLFARRWSRMLAGLAILVPAWRAIAAVALAPGGLERSLLLLLLVSFGDIAAYLVGKPLGRTKIAPRVSPGKSLEGLVGAIVWVCLMAYTAGFYLLGLHANRLWGWTAAAALLVLFSVIGDLTESRAKRIAGVKDSGRLLPGHGGILDRIDGFTAAAPIYALASLWFLRA